MKSSKLNHGSKHKINNDDSNKENKVGNQKSSVIIENNAKYLFSWESNSTKSYVSNHTSIKSNNNHFRRRLTNSASKKDSSRPTPKLEYGTGLSKEKKLEEELSSSQQKLQLLLDEEDELKKKDPLDRGEIINLEAQFDIEYEDAKDETRKNVDADLESNYLALQSPVKDEKENEFLKDEIIFSYEKDLDDDDEYDFALVLEPDVVYSYWAKILDFQSETLCKNSNYKQEQNTLVAVEQDDLDENEKNLFLSHSRSNTPHIRKKKALQVNITPRTPNNTKLTNAATTIDSSKLLSTSKSLFDRAIETTTPPHPASTFPHELEENLKEEAKNIIDFRNQSQDFRRDDYSNVYENLDRSPDLEQLFPIQLVPRGIASRDKGMQKFLQILGQGTIMKRIQPNNSHFVRVLSHDAGDTISFEYIIPQEPQQNRGEEKYDITEEFKDEIPSNVSNESNKDNDDRVISSAKTRNRNIYDYVQKFFYSTSVSTSNIITVQPATDIDPASNIKHERGTANLRSCAGTYNAERTFSLLISGMNKINSEHYTSIDLEALSMQDYWLFLRGFLLLNRDASVGRFASHRAKGISSFYNHLQNEQRLQINKKKKKLQQQCDNDDENVTNIMDNEKFSFQNLRDKFFLKCNSPDHVEFVGKGITPPPSDYFLGYYTAGTQIWGRLRHAGLLTNRLYALDTKKVMLRIRCSSQRLKDVAEAIRMKMLTKEGFYCSFEESSISQFAISNECYCKGTNAASQQHCEHLFSSSERQLIIDFIVRSRIRDAGADLGKQTALGKKIMHRIPLHKAKQLNTLYNSWVLFWRLQDKEETENLDNGNKGLEGDNAPILYPSIIRRYIISAFHQPLDSVQKYYGEGVAFYFAWIQHCTMHLILPSIAGLIVFICQISSGTYDHPILIYYANFMMLWSFIVMITWRRRSNYLAHKWGSLNYEEEEITRPQFHGKLKYCSITNEWIIQYPTWKRWLKYCLSIPLCIFFTIGTLIGILTVSANRNFLLSKYYTNKKDFIFEFSAFALTKEITSYEIRVTKNQLTDPTFWFLTLGIPTMLALCLPLLNFILIRFSMLLNEFENYQTESMYRNHLIVKVFAFRFVCYFASLYYYSYLSTISRGSGMGMIRVITTLLVFITIGYWWNLCVQVYIPHLLLKWRMKRRKASISVAQEDLSSNSKEMSRSEQINKKLLVQQASCSVWDQEMLPDYNSFHDYVHVIMNFGYVTCFSVVLPITPLVALVNNLCTMRLDAYKLCKARRRPLAQKSGGLGVWEHCLHIVTVIAVVTNCGLIAFTTSQFDTLQAKSGYLGVFLVVVAWEHVMLFVKYLLDGLVPKIPVSVQNERKRKAFITSRERNSLMRNKMHHRFSENIEKSVVLV